MAGKIFINYRRGDEPGFAQALLGRLEHAFPTEQLFIDVDNIPPGEDFVQVLESQVARCDVLLAMIGKSWLCATDERGVRRLDDPHDFVRIEIESALRQGKRVIPVLVHDAQMPRADELPDPIRPLATRNAVRLTHERFRADVEGLVKYLERAFDELDTPRLRRERDEALRQLSTIKLRLESEEKERSTQATRIEQLLEKVNVIENEQQRLTEEASTARQESTKLRQTLSESESSLARALSELADFRTKLDAAESEAVQLKAQLAKLASIEGSPDRKTILNKKSDRHDSPLYGVSPKDENIPQFKLSPQRPEKRKEPETKRAVSGVDGLFRTKGGYVVQLDKTTALIQAFGAFYIFRSLADYRKEFADQGVWTEVMDKDEKRKFLASAQRAFREANKQCPALQAIDVDH